MRSASSRLVLAAAVFAAASCGAQAPSRPKTDDFAAFWSQFRGAVAANDKPKLASLTAFPFQTRGVSDSDPVEDHDKTWFVQNLDRLLDQDSGMSAQPEKMRAYIAKQAVIPRTERPSDGVVRISSFVFKRIGGKWLFAFAYLED